MGGSDPSLSDLPPVPPEGLTHPTSQSESTARRRRMGDVVSPRLFWALIGLSVLAFVGILYLTSYLNFFWDEWAFVSYDRAWNLRLFLMPNNEHWSAVPLLVWKLLFIVVGLRSHIPYEAALLAFHVTAVLLLFTLIRRRSGDLPAFGAALILLVLGSGGTDIVWAFQIGFVGSVAFGLLAMVLLEGNPPFPSRIFPASAALLCSLMSSGVGVVFLAALAVELAVDRQRRRFLLVLAAPTAAYAAWFIAFGPGPPKHPDSILNLAGFVTWGLEASTGGISGLSVAGAAFAPILATLFAIHWYRHGRLQSWQLGMAVGIVVWFTLGGLEQTPTVQAVAGDPRNVYVGAVFLLPLVADAAGELPWQRLWRPILAASFLVIVTSNVIQLWDHAVSQTDLMRTENAELQTVEVFRGAPDMSLSRPLDDQGLSQLNAANYFAAIDMLGSPVPPASLDSLRQLPWQSVDRLMVTVFSAVLTFAPDSNRSMVGLPCQTIDSTSGATLDFQVADGQWLVLQASEVGDAFLFLGFLGPPSTEPLRHVQLEPGTPQWIHVPTTGRPTTWRLRIRTSPMGLLQTCGNSPVQVNQPLDMYYAKASSGNLDSPGWSPVSDPSTSNGQAAVAHRGTYVTFESLGFGGQIAPTPHAYDVWYRVRVTDASSSTTEMTLGVWDDQAQAWLVSPGYSAKQIGTTYVWIRVATGISTIPRHTIHFLASFIYRLGTDWYVDEAVMVPSASAGRTG
jgi:hypothetical protein